MKLFIDTANVEDIEALAPLGIIDGVTTNPSLLAKVGGDPRAVLKRICDVVQGPVSAEVVATDSDGMVREGRELAAIDPHIVVKVPFGKAGVQACRTLTTEGTRVNVTLIFSAAQALLAAKVDASFVSPFVGRLDDIGSLMEAHKVTEADGEALLLYLAGLSAGQRQAPINGKDWLAPSAIAWAFAAEYGGD